MDVNRQFVFRQALVNWEQLLAIQSLTVQISEAAETAQAELVDRALQLIERCLNIAGWQSEKSDEALGMLARNRRDRIVGNPGDLDSALALEPIGARRRDRQHMDVDAQLIHVFQS